MTKPCFGAGKSSRLMRYFLSREARLRSASQPLVGPVSPGEPPGGERRGAFGRRFGAGFDGRERDTIAGDESELRDAARVGVRDDLLIAPGHHVVSPPVQELGGVHDEQPRLACLGFRSEQRHRVSGLRFGRILGGGQPLELQGVPLIVVGDLTVFRARDFGGHFAVPFVDRSCHANRARPDSVTRPRYLMDWIVGDSSGSIRGSSGSMPSLVPVSTSPFSRVCTSSAHPRDIASPTSASTTPIARNENRSMVPVPESARSKVATPTATPRWNGPVSCRYSSWAQPVTEAITCPPLSHRSANSPPSPGSRARELARAVTNGCPHQPPTSLVSAANTAAGVPAISMSSATSIVGRLDSMCLPSPSTVSASRSSAEASPAATGSVHLRCSCCSGTAFR